MKNIRLSLLLLIVISVFVSCNNKNNEARYSITGTIQNAENKKLVLQEVPFDGKEMITLDSVTLKQDGKYNFDFIAKTEGLYILAIENDTINNFSIVFVNDEKNIQINADPGKIETYTIKGSKTSESLMAFLKEYKSKDISIFETMNKLAELQNSNGDAATIDTLQKERNNKIAALNSFTQNAINNATNPSMIYYLLGLSMRSMETSQVLALAKSAAEKTKSEALITFATSLGNQIQSNITPGAIAIGQPAPEIALADTKGKIVTLSSFKGKYVLVDFWASWCGPCRAENPNVVQAYDKFKKKNFTILGVSLDDNKEDWEEAIKADNLNWAHISDLKKWESTVVSTYKIEGIPFNVLVDPNGMVIATELRGPALEETLNKLIKE
jgi:peroxiredoxin